MIQEEKYGFVYVWFDKKYPKFYIGCHWGTEDDGYICSSRTMRKAYRRRPTDFKRRIICRITGDRTDLLEEEYKWLQLIPKEQLGKKYYNLRIHHYGHWVNNPDTKLSIGEKISKTQKSTPGFGKWNKGKFHTEEQNKKTSEATSIAMKKHYKNNPRSEEYRKKISENNKRLQADKKIGMHGKVHTEKTKERMSKNNAMNNPIYAAKVKASKQGIRWLTNDLNKKMAVPGTDKFNTLILDGYRLI